MSRAKVIRWVVQTLTFLIGVGLIYYGIDQGRSHEGSWNLWVTVNVLGPIGLGVLLAIPEAVRRALDVIAPRVPYLHDHDEES